MTDEISSGKTSEKTAGIGAEKAVEKQYWFPAKTHGWGWGLPIRWQGWLVLLLFVVAAVAGRVLLFPAGTALSHLLYMGFWCALLLAVCWLKGEPPGWRWGKK